MARWFALGVGAALLAVAVLSDRAAFAIGVVAVAGAAMAVTLLWSRLAG